MTTFHSKRLEKIHEPGTIEVKSWHKIGEVEKEFYTRFGLNVQICYRSGGKWIQTGRSDNMTIDSLIKNPLQSLIAFCFRVVSSVSANVQSPGVLTLYAVFENA